MTCSIRCIQLAMMACIALFFSLVAFNNLMDTTSNLPAVQHVLSMDTTFKTPWLMKRAIVNPSIQLAAYYLISIWELITALLCWLACFRLAWNLRARDKDFRKAKETAFIGLFFGFLLYMLGFIIIGGEWFFMWQSPTWNAQATAGLFTSLILFVMIFLAVLE